MAFVTGSARPLIQLTYSGKSQEILSSPFFNIFAPHFLGLMSEKEARQLIREPAQAIGAPLPPETEDFIYDLVGGHPLSLQVACFHAIDTPDDLAEIERQTMLELTPHFQYYWQNLTPEEQSTLRQLSNVADRAISDTTLRGILRDLVQKSLLVQHQDAYRYPSRAWERFLSSAFVVNQAAPGDASPKLSPGVEGVSTGARLGAYEVLDLLGRGGMAEVYRGRHPRLDRIVAIKVLSERMASQSDFRQRFEREAQAVAALRHPSIVQVFDFGDVEGVYYMVMEYIEGLDLGHYLQETGPMPGERVCPILRNMARALDYAHAQGIVHRDVKPSNVMLCISEDQPNFWENDDCCAILTDFGIAKIRAGGTGVTKTGMMMGTLDYMAPEQIRGARRVDGRADVYSLGVMAYRMLTGKLPFQGDNLSAVMMAHLHEPPPDPRSVAPDMPEEVALAIMRALAKDPEERHPKASAMIEAMGW